LKALIIGGGIAGLTTAIALRLAGHEAHIFEQAPEPREVGAGIGLGANAIKSLRHLGLADKTLGAGDSWRTAELRSRSGKVFVQLDFSRYERSLGAPATVIHRADLLAILLSAVPLYQVHFGRTFRSYSQAGGTVRAEFLDGSAAEADILIGADGLNSAVRAQMLGPTPPRYAGYTCWRGVVPYPYSKVPPGYVAEIWGRGSRFGVVRTGGERIYWFATLNSPPLRAGEPLPPQKHLLLRHFSDWALPVPELLELTPDESILRNDICDRPPVRRWSKGRVLLIGDAAHPTTPNIGQGGGMAIEDALILARLLRSGDPPESCFERFTRERYPRTAAITRESWRFGVVGQWERRWLCSLRDSVMGRAPRRLAIRNLLKHHRFDPGPIA
jgi:2-polyprenyl-6-methoxyphenol hydroxylase-like FAD-dependent oxidoreductase